MVLVARTKTPDLVLTMGCPDGVLPVTGPLRLPTSEIGGVVMFLLSDVEAVLAAAGLGNWMVVTLTLIWLPVGKCPGACGIDTEVTFGTFKLCTPVAFFTAVEVVAIVVVDGFTLDAVVAPDFWTARPSPLANPAAAVTGEVSLPSGA
jgi:hypothetical protein